MPVSTPSCKTFWTWAAIAAAVIALLLTWKVLALLLRPLGLWLEEKRLRARERKIADAATMAEYKADEAKLHSGPAQEDVERKIREALLEKKLTDQQQRHHQKTGDKK